MNYYFTFNDSYSGVYHSQVIDVVKLYKENNVDIKLIAFVSPRTYLSDKKNIKNHLSDSIVLPSVPKLSNWRLNKYLLSSFTSNKSTIICRGVFSTNIALQLKYKFDKIVYDGRGAIKAEQEEYGVYSGTGTEKDISLLEKKAILNSDFRISVSHKLIEYWKREYGYKTENHTIIPCSLGDNFIVSDGLKDYSLLPGLEENDILLIYSGSLAGWQALDNLEELLSDFMNNTKIKILFLSQHHQTIENLIKKYPNRIFRKWLSPVDVPRHLMLGDYGILLRNDNWTNRVASPVKFAEYISAGLKVLISENIGDFSELVKENNLGFVIGNTIDIDIKPVPSNEKKRIKQFAIDNFSKKIVSNKYLDIIK